MCTAMRSVLDAPTQVVLIDASQVQLPGFDLQAALRRQERERRERAARAQAARSPPAAGVVQGQEPAEDAPIEFAAPCLTGQQEPREQGGSRHQRPPQTTRLEVFM